MYYIVEKFERSNDNLVCTELGYVESASDVEYINTNNGYDSFIQWMKDNEDNLKTQTVSLSDCTNLPCYGCRSSVNNINGSNLHIISDLDSIGGL